MFLFRQTHNKSSTTGHQQRIQYLGAPATNPLPGGTRNKCSSRGTRNKSSTRGHPQKIQYHGPPATNQVPGGTRNKSSTTGHPQQIQYQEAPATNPVPGRTCNTSSTRGQMLLGLLAVGCCLSNRMQPGRTSDILEFRRAESFMFPWPSIPRYPSPLNSPTS